MGGRLPLSFAIIIKASRGAACRQPTAAQEWEPNDGRNSTEALVEVSWRLELGGFRVVVKASGESSPRDLESSVSRRESAHVMQVGKLHRDSPMRREVGRMGIRDWHT